MVGVDRYLARPLEVIGININGTRNVLAAASRVGARVVVASTSEVFGKNPAVPWREDNDRLLGPTTAGAGYQATVKRGINIWRCLVCSGGSTPDSAPTNPPSSSLAISRVARMCMCRSSITG